LVWSVRGADHSSAWFHRIECANDFVVYVADPAPTTWTRLCMRQADALLLLARADAPAAPWPVMPADGPGSAAARSELVLLHDGADDRALPSHLRRHQPAQRLHPAGGLAGVGPQGQPAAAAGVRRGHDRGPAAALLCGLGESDHRQEQRAPAGRAVALAARL